MRKKGEHENQVIYLDRIPEDSPLNLDASVNCSADYGELAAGRETELRFSFTNDGAAPCRYRLVFSPDPPADVVRRGAGGGSHAGPHAGEERFGHASRRYCRHGADAVGAALPRRPFGQETVRPLPDRQSPAVCVAGAVPLPERSAGIFMATPFSRRIGQKVNQHRHSLGSGCKAVSAPSGRGLELQYCWRRPVSGWNWMARRYAPLEKIL
ncbi:MAG: hypothetical protein L6W00_17550 [Lentisphaeria bacterium]|nr:MAG: hypothetical protein L6W00_17550 [Lentisphaeria bacterium]